MNASEGTNEFGIELPQRIEETLDTRHRMFQLSYSKLQKIRSFLIKTVIYNSEWCRIKFEYSQRFPPDRHELHISYGRLHAPSDNHLMKWQGEERHCWHGSGLLYLDFLDGLSPAETLERQFSEKRLPVLEEFSRTEASQRALQEPGQLYPLVREAAIWKHYGMQLFELFDLRQIDLWTKYVAFLKGYYEHKRRSGYSGDPSIFNVC